MKRPQQNEYVEYYSAYVGRVPNRDVIEVLAEAPDALGELLSDLSEGEERFAYAAGKWSIRELIGHLCDTERVFSYRAAHMARNDPAELPGMDQDVWVAGSNAADRPLVDQLGEFRAIRAANVSLFGSFDDATLSREGVASGVRFTVRSLVYIVAGHEIHHRGVLVDRYLSALGSRGGA